MSYATPTPARAAQAQAAPGEPFGLRKHIARTQGLKEGETKKPVVGEPAGSPWALNDLS